MARSGESPMNHAEWLALAGLVRLMVHSDGVVTRKEHRFVSNLAQRFGSEAWSSMAEAELRLTSEALVKAQAARVVRPETRAQIRAILVELAAAGGVGNEEQ